jgi:hypothetical protein
MLTLWKELTARLVLPLAGRSRLLARACQAGAADSPSDCPGWLRYSLAHNHGVSTLNKEKLKQMCEKTGLAFPDLASPPPLPPEVQQREAAAAAAAAAAAEQQAEAVEARQAREALLAAAAPDAEGSTAMAAAQAAQ